MIPICFACIIGCIHFLPYHKNSGRKRGKKIIKTSTFLSVILLVGGSSCFPAILVIFILMKRCGGSTSLVILDSFWLHSFSCHPQQFSFRRKYPGIHLPCHPRNFLSEENVRGSRDSSGFKKNHGSPSSPVRQNGRGPEDDREGAKRHGDPGIRKIPLSRRRDISLSWGRGWIQRDGFEGYSEI